MPYNATLWPNLQPGPVTNIPGTFALAPAPVEGPVAIPPPALTEVITAPAAPAPNPTTYKSSVVTARETRAFFGLVDGVDTQPPTTLEVNNAGQTITVVKEPV